MLVVYRAEDTSLGREVAIKVLPEHEASNQERLGRLEREARLLARLNHPNIVALHAVERSEAASGGHSSRHRCSWSCQLPGWLFWARTGMRSGRGAVSGC